MNSRLCTVLTLSALVLVLGCSGKRAGSPVGPVVQNPGTPFSASLLKSTLGRDSSVSPFADVAAITNGNNEFAWNLFGKLQTANGNVFISPYSVTSALAMTWAGARTETYKEMAQALKFPYDSTRFHKAMNTLDLALTSRGKGAAGNEGQGFALKISNAIWCEQTHTFLPTFLDPLALYYGAGVFPCDFVHSAERARLGINEWASDQTNGKIKNLIPQGDLDKTTKLVLTNTVYFDAAWADTFLHESTNDGTFRLAAGDTIVTKFMHKTDSCSYSEDQNFQALELPYDGRQVSMVILLPKAASGVTSASIDYQEVVGLVAGMSRNLVDVSLPKFSFTYGTCDLQLPLKNMGMLRAFGVGTPDFSGIDGDYDLVISKVLHQAYVCVDEKGTTAAAATAVVMIGTTYSPILTSNRKIFTADHPFVFLIRDVPTGQILFLGYMANPAGTN